FIIGTNTLISQTDVDLIKRGVVAVKNGSTGIYVGWRLLGNDTSNIAFNVYRITDGGAGTKLNGTPITGATNYFDASATLASVNEYFIVPVISGVEQQPSDTVGIWNQNYLTVALNRPAGGTTPDNVVYTYSPNDASVADLDGDGEYEIIIKWDPSNAHDNSQSGYTGNTILDAYEFNGTRIWRIDLGINVRSGAHYNPFMVYDFDQDGMAELICRTAPGTQDGTGNFLSDGPAASANHSADYRNSGGYILTGPEYLTVFKGTDGTELETINLEPDRGNVTDWGDGYGNRVDRFLGAVLYLDGEHPSVVWCRGIYTKVEIAAYNWDGTNLSQIWIFKSQEGYDEWTGMGSHNLSIGDVDGDGKDEIVYGQCAIDDDGTGLWSLKSAIGTSTGDAMHLADFIPERPGLERWACAEYSQSGSHLVDAATGEVLWKTPAGDVARATAGDLVQEFYGMECWGGTDGLRSACNIYAGPWPSSTNHVVWWDADLGRELLNDIHIDKYNSGNLLTATGCYSNNGSKANPCLQADIFGDWREEVIWRTTDNTSIRIYTTTDVTDYRIKTLMQDRQYRLAIAWQNNSYNQPPHTSFYLGYDMFTPAEDISPSMPAGLKASIEDGSIVLSWNANLEGDIQGYNIFKSVNDGDFVLLNGSLVDTTVFADSAITLYELYKYYITAHDVDGNESLPSEIVSAFPTLEEEMLPPENVTGRMGNTKNLVFWDAFKESGPSFEVPIPEGLTLMHSYTFEDGTADDKLGSAHGILYGGTIASGKYTASANGQYIELPTTAININTYSSITLEAYIYSDYDNTGATMLAYFGGIENNVGGNGYFLTPDRWTESRTAISCGNLTQPWTAEQGVTSDPVTIGKKHHIVSVLTDTSITLYIDGAYAGTDVVSGSNSIANLSNSKAYLCKSGYASDPTWVGTIDAFNIFEGAMDAKTVASRAYIYSLGEFAGYNVYYSSNDLIYIKLNSDILTDTVYIHEGLTNGAKHYYKITSVDDNGIKSDYSEPVIIVPGDTIIVQAEEGKYMDAQVDTIYDGYNGSGYVNFNSGGHLDLQYVYCNNTGLYDLVLRYAQSNGSGNSTMYVNDTSFLYTMYSTTAWTNYTYDTLKLNLDAGFNNTIRIEASGSDFGNLDEIIIIPNPSDGIFDQELVRSFTAYPNPFNGIVNLELNHSGIHVPTIRIFNIYGLEVERAQFENSGSDNFRYRWNGTGYNAGIYFATVYLNDKACKTLKLVLINGN
ncbi:MAG: hypothetical protein JXB49_09740, partial [Bacteroidales bacterium]|nr:hypothetical protein [Bacteroidales bacterium]